VIVQFVYRRLISMVQPIVIRPLPWFRELLEEMMLANPEKTKTEIIHDIVGEWVKLKNEKRLSASLPSAAPMVNDPSVSIGEMVRCVVWNEDVPKAQCELCIEKRTVPTCPKIGGKLKTPVTSGPEALNP
jgi:hypothetical protein